MKNHKKKCLQYKPKYSFEYNMNYLKIHKHKTINKQVQVRKLELELHRTINKQVQENIHKI